ncbi:MAG: homoserine O-acetyltransferase [Ignavibacteriales bacterium]|nr:homoserine O-acetyltransferase [Ignavibacteriales bacterium]
MSNLIAETNFVNLFSEDHPFKFENGSALNSVTVAYQTFGTLNSENSNVIMINHALTGNAHITGIITEKEIKNCEHEKHLANYNEMYEGKEGWWSPLIGPGKSIDTDKYFVICSNVLGSCYGTSGPTSLNPNTGKKYNLKFPEVTVRDMINVQKGLVDYLGIKKIKLAIGGSLGGMQVLEWAIMYPNIIESIMPIGASVGHSAWAIGLNEASRNAIKNDPAWKNGNYIEQPELGFSLARKIAMLSYRSYESFMIKFGREKSNGTGLFDVENYLNYQGEKITKRFDANAYLYLSEAMDSHDVGIGRGGIEKALNSISCKTECVGISSDLLYPAEEQKEIVSRIPNATYSEINSIHGHDAFLIEFDQLDKIIRNFLV